MGPRIAEWYTKAAAAVQNAIQCCRVISDRRKNHIKTSADCFFKCLVTQSCPTLSDCRDCNHQAPLSMEFSRQEYWNGSPCPPPGDLPNPGIKPRSPAFQVDFFFSFFFFYHLGHQGRQRILEWVAYPVSWGTSWPRN